jgi:hypothetical protein
MSVAIQGIHHALRISTHGRVDADEASTSSGHHAHPERVRNTLQIGKTFFALACACEISGTHESASAYIRELRNALR